MGDSIAAMAFYGMGGAEWDAAPEAQRRTMLGTVPYFMQIQVHKPDRLALRALRTPEERLRWVNEYADNEARRAVCLMEVDDLATVWARLKAEARAGRLGLAPEMDPVAPHHKHPLFATMVELLQRAIVTLEVHDELGGTGADGMSPHQVTQLRSAATKAAAANVAHHVPSAVIQLLEALKPQMAVRR